MGDEERLSGVLGDRRMRQLSDHLDLTRNAGSDGAGRFRVGNCY